MANPEHDLTFGVELEFVFVFHEKLILGELKRDYAIEKGGGSPLSNGGLLEGDELAQWRELFLRKDLTEAGRRGLRQGAPQYSIANPEYLSWGVRMEASPGPGRQAAKDRFEGVQSTGPPEENEQVRTYATEPLQVAKEVIRSNGAFDYWTSSRRHIFSDANVYDGTDAHKPLTEFKMWHFTNDFSLSALKQGTLEAYLMKYKVCPDRDGVRQFTNEELLMNVLNTGGAPKPDFEVPEMANMIDYTEQPVERVIYGLNEIPKRSSKQGDASDQAARDSSRDLRRLSTASPTGETTEEESPESSGQAPKRTVLGKRSRPPGVDNEGGDRARAKRRGDRTEQPSSGSTDAVTRSQLDFSPLTVTGSSRPARKKRKIHVFKGPPWLEGRKTGLPNLKEWDSYGIELVSPVLDQGTPALNDIRKFCSLLKGQPCHDHGATINTTCGLHIHLKPRKTDFELPTLKHLAYILVMYEAQIETLHPRYRRTNNGHNTFDRQTNIDDLIFRGENRRSLPEIRELIHIIGDTQALAAIMGRGKGRIVNFSNLLRVRDENGPRTLEFRQHEGVLKAEMVVYWVCFCVGLLRLATDMAHKDVTATGAATTGFEAQCRIYPFQEWDGEDNTDIRSNISVCDLFDLMNLPQDVRSYFQRRAAYFAPEYDGRRPIPAPASTSTDSDDSDSEDTTDDAADVHSTSVERGTPLGPGTAARPGKSTGTGASNRPSALAGSVAPPGPTQSTGQHTLVLSTIAESETSAQSSTVAGKGIPAGPATSAASDTTSGPDTGLETLVLNSQFDSGTQHGLSVSHITAVNTQRTSYLPGIPQGNAATSSTIDLPGIIPETPRPRHKMLPQKQDHPNSTVVLPETIPETPLKIQNVQKSRVGLLETIPESPPLQTQHVQNSSARVFPETIPETPQ